MVACVEWGECGGVAAMAKEVKKSGVKPSKKEGVKGGREPSLESKGSLEGGSSSRGEDTSSQPTLTPPKPKGPHCPPGHDLHYGGYAWQKGRSLLPLELQLYRTNWPKERGGLGALGHFRNAWKLVWPKFEWNEWTKGMVEAWCGYSRISIMGHAAAGKTFTLGRIALLDWLADPFNTITSLATVTAEGLRLRMWGDLMRAYEELPPEIKLNLKIYNTPNRMNIMLDGGGADQEKFLIEGMSVSRTKDALGRIRGKHAPRRRVIYDEADDMSEAAYDAMANIMTDPDVKVVDMSNAMDRYSQFGRACEPAGGWATVDATSLYWEGKPAGKFRSIVVHLDGLQNPNVKAAGGNPLAVKKYPYMLGVDEIASIRAKYGEDSKEWWTMVRGYFPPDGVVAKIFPGVAIERAKLDLTFDFEPEWVASLDPAFEHDDCALHFGKMGKVRDGRTGITGVESFKILTKEEISAGSKDMQIARQVKELCEARRVRPRNFIMDKTGGGRGVYAMLQEIWSPDVQGINYGGEATERPLRVGDSDKAKDVVRYFVSELWFRARYLCEDGLLGGLNRLEPKTIDDLNVRRYETKQVTQGRIMQAETKDDLKKRLGRSPDWGDAFVQFGELLARDISLIINEETKRIPAERWNQSWNRVKKLRRVYSDEAIDVQVW